MRKHIQDLKAFLNKSWKEINAETCGKMMESISFRLSAVIHKNGEQIAKYDYK